MTNHTHTDTMHRIASTAALQAAGEAERLREQLATVRQVQELAYTIAVCEFAGALALNETKLANGATVAEIWDAMEDENAPEVYQVIMVLALMRHELVEGQHHD